MKQILQVTDPNVYASYVDAPVLHPLVSIIHYDELAPFRSALNNYGVYGLFIQKSFPKNLSYGMLPFQPSDASIIAVAPGQTGGAEDNGQKLSISGWGLLFSPELLSGSALAEQIHGYRFFSYFIRTPSVPPRPNGGASRSFLYRCGMNLGRAMTHLHCGHCW